MKKYLLHSFTLIVLYSSHLAAINLSDLQIEEGFQISLFAENLDSPRQMVEGSKGTIFVAERNGQIVALKDSDNNGQADSRMIIAKNLSYSTGISLFDGDLYFSEISKIWKIENIEEFLIKQTSPNETPKKTLVVDNLPEDTWHGWKWLKHDDEGSLYFNIGAPCNVCLSDNSQYATILKYKNGDLSYVAKGVRNSVGFDFHPISKKLFFTDNGRDWLGDDSPSCELNKVDLEGQFFGFPYKHASDVYDPEYGNKKSGYDFIDPILELGAHVAPTGISFYEGDMFPEKMRNNLFIALHGSWNRSEKVGYKVLRVEFDAKENVISSTEFISGWLKDGKVSGRPSAPLIRRDGSFLLSDDKANVIYRITYSS